MRPYSGVGKEEKNRLFLTLNKFGNNKKWQFLGGARSPGKKIASKLFLYLEVFYTAKTSAKHSDSDIHIA